MRFNIDQMTEIKTLYNLYKPMYSYQRLCTLIAIKYGCEDSDVRRATEKLYREDIAKGFFV